jgi:DNA-binding CsgD family transcriptional regulator
LIDEDEPVVIAVAIEDGRLAERLIAALHEAPGIRLARPGEPADATLVAVDGRRSHPSAAIADDMALTPRELEVLALMAEGASNKTIAQRLGISVHTAKFHVGQVLDKLDATGRTDAVAHAARRGVIQL